MGLALRLGSESEGGDVGKEGEHPLCASKHSHRSSTPSGPLPKKGAKIHLRIPNFYVRLRTTWGFVRWLVGWLVGRITHSFDDLHGAHIGLHGLVYCNALSDFSSINVMHISTTNPYWYQPLNNANPPLPLTTPIFDLRHPCGFELPDTHAPVTIPAPWLLNLLLLATHIQSMTWNRIWSVFFITNCSIKRIKRQ